MISTYIDNCFAVLHPAHGTRAALICGQLSDTALNAYRALAFLGETLAAGGIPALRLAYRGTGDSAGTDDEPDRFDQWLHSIATGVAWLQSECGVTSVTLIGHQIGASLAARAACDLEAVDALVLLCPLSGRQFLNQLTLAARLSQRVWKTSHKSDDGTWFEAHGLRISHATRDALMRLDARKLPSLPASRVLVMDVDSRPVSKALAAGMQQSGAAASFAAFDRLDAMQRDSYEAEVPYTAFTHIVDWAQALPMQQGTPRTPGISSILRLDASQETPVCFGRDDALFGILSLPERRSPSAPALLLLNSSANPRWGNARLAVDLARTLAEDGIATLRMDASGMGDASLSTGEHGQPYSASVTADVMTAVAELEKHTGRPVVVMGFCSGAYHALQAAVQEPQVHGLILVNLQYFVWREGDLIVQHNALRPSAFYLRSIFRAETWYRVIRADFNLVTLSRVLIGRPLRQTIATLDPLLSMLGGGLTRVGRVRRSMRALGVRNVRILYALSCNDPGVAELAEYFGRNGWRLRRQPNVTYHVLQDADHTLEARPLRAALIAMIRGWCHSEWGGVGDKGVKRPEGVLVDAQNR